MIAFYLRIFENRAVDLLGESEMVLSNEVEAEFRDFCRIYFGNLVPIPNPTNNLLGGSLGDCNFIFGAFNVNALPVQIFYFDDVRTGFTFVTVRDHLSEGRRFPPPPV